MNEKHTQFLFEIGTNDWDVKLVELRRKIESKLFGQPKCFDLRHTMDDVEITMGLEFEECWKHSMENQQTQRKISEKQNNDNENKEENNNDDMNDSIVKEESENKCDELPPFYVKIIVRADIVESFAVCVYFDFFFCVLFLFLATKKTNTFFNFCDFLVFSVFFFMFFIFFLHFRKMLMKKY